MLFRRISRRLFSACLLLVALSATSQAQPKPRRPVLMISIDGMHPSYVFEAEKKGWKVPGLREFVTKGAYAASVTNVNPTVTYPNHTTMVTGVLPKEHGIYTNTVFDPSGKEQAAWNWYGAEVKVPTLWQAVKAAGLVTGSVFWPVTVHSKGIDYNVPEYWRVKRESDHYLMEAVSTPSGFLEEVEKTAGIFHGDEGTVDLDEKITRTAIGMIEKGRPALLTVHLVAFDHAQHLHGPWSKEAKEVLEKLDGMVARMMAAEVKTHPNADIVIISDHGFFPVNHKLNLNAALTKAGLIRLTDGPKPQLASWKAYAWSSGGSASIVLHDANDRATEEQVNQILRELANDPANGIAHVLRGKDAVDNGALPQASFLVDLKSGYAMGAGLTGQLVEDSSTTTGTHGYLNTNPEMNSSFFIVGPGILKGKNLGKIDMLQIAPTLARELGVELPLAKAQPLAIRN